MEGLPRINNTTVDLGAYEFTLIIRYVTPAGAGTGVGTSWANASPDLQLMINNSNYGDQIWVAAGTYKPNRRADALGTITPASKYNAFVLKSGVKIYGGFVGNETSLVQQNWTANATILSGDINTAGDATDNTYHVVISSGAVGDAELNGFTISSGYADLWWDHIPVNGIEIYTGSGGGIACNTSSPILANLNISNCRALKGGAVFNDHSSPAITGVTMGSNTATENGGGICNVSFAPTLTDVIIKNNSTQNDGGGVMNDSSSPSFTNVTIMSNSTTRNGGGMFNSSSSPTITNLIIANNTANNSGGGICNKSSSYPVIKNALIYKNTCSEAGGGVFDENSTSTITNATIVYNSGGMGNGGGVFGNGNLKNSIIWGNKIGGSINNVSGTQTYSNILLEGGSGAGIVSSSNPLFVNSAADDYRLKIFSPAIDLGNNTYISGVTSDLDGENRIINPNVDLGAYEFHAFPVQVTGANGINNGTGYFTLKTAFDAINAQANQAGKNIIVAVVGSTEETATASLNSGNWTGLSIYPTASGLSISGNLDAAMINFNGADKVTIDGRMNATGSARDLTIENTSTGTSASTITLANNAEVNTLKYSIVKGSLVGSNGTICFSDGSPSKGNDANVISNNLITNSGGNRPAYSIVSGGSSSHPNTGNLITDNEFKDFLSPVAESGAIYAKGYTGTPGTTGWTITGNSFYETTTFVPTGNNSYRVIRIGDSDTKAAGTGYTISNNFIGGSAASCVGTWAKTSNGGTANNIFSAITLYLNDGTPVSTVQNNTIRNFNWTNSGGVSTDTAISWSGIEIGKGSVNVGTVTGNTIGDNTGTGSIVVTSGNADGNGSKVCGIQIQWNASVDCQNNKIGSITAANSASAIANHFYGIYNYSNNSTTISNNIIGSAATGNSINATLASTTQDQHVYGILCAGNTGSTPGTVTIGGNVIANMANAATNNSAFINGIRSEAGSTAITNNTVRDLTISNNNTQTGSLASNSGIAFINSSSTAVAINNNVVYNLTNSNAAFTGYLFGVFCSAGSGANSCSNNNIYNLSATNATGAASVVGLSYDAGLGTNTVSRNFIYGLKAPGSTDGYIYGIKKSAGAVSISNNIIAIGENTRSSFFGIYESGSANNNTILYFNTVYIGGTTGSGAVNKSYCLYSNSSANTRDFRNNIFSNERSTPAGSNLHYAAWFNYGVNTNLTLDNNDYYASGVGGKTAHVNSTEIAALPFFTGSDTRSIIGNPVFVNPGSTVAADYKIGTDLVGASGTGITSDYELAARGTYTAMGAWERLMNRNNWKGTISSAWSNPDNWLYRIVPTAGEELYFANTPSNNCVLDVDVSVAGINNTQSAYNLVLNGHKATVKGNLNLSNGAQLDATAIGSTIEFAGTSAQSIPTGTFYNNNVYNLTVNNTNNLTFTGQLNILNSLAATAGKLDATTNSPTICYAGTSAQFIDSISYLNGKVYNLTIDNAAGVSLNNDFIVDHSLTINSGKALIIPAARKLNVLGTITNDAGVDGILIKSGAAVANGTLLFHNLVNNPVYATVEMYSKAYYDSNGPAGSKYKWQYFGIPVRSLVANPTFYGSYLRQYNEPGLTTAESWLSLNNAFVLTSFKGYEMTQTSPVTIRFQGILENADMNCNLTYSPGSYYKGQHIISNPYTAAIDITQLNFSNMEASVYLYNTGSHNDWNNNSGVTTPGTSPGQYVAATKYTAGIGGIPGQIPSMQGFQVNAYSGGGNLNVPYSSLAVKNTKPQRVRKLAAESDKTYTIIDVKGSRYSDRMWLFTDPACTHSFDNGWDAFKIFGSSKAPQLCAMESDGNYQINAVNNIDNTDIGFKAGEDSNYTLTFNHYNMDASYPTLYLVDLLENKTVDISQSGATYAFASSSGSASDKRFKIVTSANISTELSENEDGKCPVLRVYGSNQTIHIENNTAQKGDLTLYDAMGRIVDNIPFDETRHTAISTKLKRGVYLVKAFTAKKTVVVPLVLP
ncbi:MAG: choice-of-anchor Q domain-containing protein [Paludibacter sp.]